MTRNIQSLLSYEIKRRPKLAAMLATDFSLNDVEKSGFPKWIRQALVDKISQRERFALHSALTNADLIVDGFMPDPLGNVRRWEGSSTFIALDRGHLQLETGNLVWLPLSGGIWYETIFSKRIDPIVMRFTSQIGIKPKSDYTKAYKALLANLASPDDPIIGAKPNPLASYGVRFY